MLEATNISVGRGTDTPFELFGAPWIHPVELAAYLNHRMIGGVRFVPIEFTPQADVYAQKKCGGVNIILTNRNSLDAPELGIEIAAALHKLYPDSFETKKLDNLMFNDATAQAIVRGDDPNQIWMQWIDALPAFKTIRAKYLLY
jgi:uncharacterized protein YbbC (DUF1343 family)